MANERVDTGDAMTEFHLGVAMIAALIFHVLEKHDLVSADEAASAIREATDQIPDDYAGFPRFAPLASLRVLLEDPDMLHTMPFHWGANRI